MSKEEKSIALKDLPPELLAKALNTLSYQMAISVGREPFIQGELLTEEDIKNIFK